MGLINAAYSVIDATGFDYSGAAYLVAALGVAVPLIITSVLSVATFIRAGRADRSAASADAKATATHLEVMDVKNNVQTIEKATNSMKDALVKATGDAAFAKGKAEGVAVERASPMVNAPT